MYDSVRSAFTGFTTPLEGCVPYMYLDVKGLVTIGIGNLIDPVSLALPLPFVRKSDSSPAAQSDVTAEWNKVKAMTSLAQQGAKAAASVTTLMLTQDAITALVLAKLDSNAATLKATPAFSSFETWPADAQLGVLSMAWALGPSFAAGWPNFAAAVGRGDWAAAAANCQISTAGNPGVAPRNTADVLLFTNAAAVAAAGSDSSVLWYPAKAPTGTPDGGTTDGGTTGSTTDGGTTGSTTDGGTTDAGTTGSTTDGGTTGSTTDGGTTGSTTDGGTTGSTTTDSGSTADGGTTSDNTAGQASGSSSPDFASANPASGN